MKSAAVNIHAQFFNTCFYFGGGHIGRSRIAGLYGDYVFNSFEELPSSFPWQLHDFTFTPAYRPFTYFLWRNIYSSPLPIF